MHRFSFAESAGPLVWSVQALKDHSYALSNIDCISACAIRTCLQVKWLVVRNKKRAFNLSYFTAEVAARTQNVYGGSSVAYSTHSMAATC